MSRRSDWPESPRLDPFRDAVWELSLGGEIQGHLVCTVGRMRSLLFWIKQEQMWFHVIWSSGEHDRRNEDYGPGWYTVSDLERGTYRDSSRGDTFAARRLEGSERDAIWDHYGADL